MNLRLRVPIPGPRWYHILLRIAGALTLVALALMVWSVMQPTPMPVLLAMSIGQALGTVAFAMYGLVVFADLRRQYVRRKDIERSGEVPVVADDAVAAGAAVTPPPGQDAPP
jgi:hypothetical protein